MDLEIIKHALMEAQSDFKFIERSSPGSNFQASIKLIDAALEEINKEENQCHTLQDKNVRCI